MFAPVAGQHEIHVAQAPYICWAYTAVGDRSYDQDSSHNIIFGSRNALIFTAAMVGARMLGNRGRRNQAAMNAQPRWVQADHGMMVVGNLCAYFTTLQGETSPWPWESISQMQLLNRYTIQLTGTNVADDTLQLQIRSPFAELMFAFWAVARHPRHAQLRCGAWLPPGWLDWAVSQGRVPQWNADTVRGVDPLTQSTIQNTALHRLYSAGSVPVPPQPY